MDLTYLYDRRLSGLVSSLHSMSHPHARQFDGAVVPPVQDSDALCFTCSTARLRVWFGEPGSRCRGRVPWWVRACVRQSCWVSFSVPGVVGIALARDLPVAATPRTHALGDTSVIDDWRRVERGRIYERPLSVSGLAVEEPRAMMRTAAGCAEDSVAVSDVQIERRPSGRTRGACPGFVAQRRTSAGCFSSGRRSSVRCRGRRRARVPWRRHEADRRAPRKSGGRHVRPRRRAGAAIFGDRCSRREFGCRHILKPRSRS